jgi:hypothetical protein
MNDYKREKLRKVTKGLEKMMSDRKKEIKKEMKKGRKPQGMTDIPKASKLEITAKLPDLKSPTTKSLGKMDDMKAKLPDAKPIKGTYSTSGESLKSLKDEESKVSDKASKMEDAKKKQKKIKEKMKGLLQGLK